MFGALSVAKVPMPEVAWVNETFPLLASGKLLDQDVLVHSLGCSVWNTFWFHKSSASPVCLIEFERFDGSAKGQQKLEEKLKNLLEAAQRWNHCPKTLVLSAWSQGLVGVPDTQKLKDICRMGFTSSTGTQVIAAPDVEVVFSRFLFIKNLNMIVLDRIHYEVLM